MYFLTFLFYVIVLLIEVRREARKAFLALSSAEKTADGRGSEPNQNLPDDLMEEPATDVAQSTHGIPVSLYFMV